jgi:hypothetical protein
MENLHLDQAGTEQGGEMGDAQHRSESSLYESDFYQWVQQTAAALKAKAFNQVDWTNVIEEIESMGRSERRELKSRLIVLLEHLLKLQYWTSERDLNERGWRNTIIEQRRQIQLVLDDSPSLRTMLNDLYADAYCQAREDLILKAQLPEATIPHEQPYALTEALNSKTLLA